ncbi:hypothetical protein G6N74_28755 [Mesorhizobium sp. CGMCC 1.15528]|uniref:Uncharacterized protein n=1 Tax=Mesorhizobium zhangyense TaxID=1776730 RepID=A0A7C9VIC0_9HYPH|nr:hypothetical protein [Mesorhizobium zhangyense]NGN45051.1 hypothetical protein [Mesorhizobium zhangyense]
MDETEFDCRYLASEEIDLLRRVYDRALASRNIAPGSKEADELALRIMIMYQAGVRNEEALRGDEATAP